MFETTQAEGREVRINRVVHIPCLERKFEITLDTAQRDAAVH